MLRAGIVLGSVCVSVCLSICLKSRKLLTRNWCNLVEICPTINAKSVWKLVIFDLDLWPWELWSYFRIFPAQVIPFEWLYLANSFLVWGYIFRTSRSWFSFKVMIQGQGHGSAKAVACKSNLLVANCWGLIGISVTTTLEVIRSFWQGHGVNLKVTVVKQRQRVGLCSRRTQLNINIVLDGGHIASHCVTLSHYTVGKSLCTATRTSSKQHVYKRL